MRLSTVLLLALAASLPVTPAVCVAAPEAPEAAPEVASAPADDSPGIPWHFFWPGGLCLGYISMDLKRHLQRRGHEPAGRDRAFAGLISLKPRPTGGEPSREAAPPVSSGRPQ